MYMKKYLLAEFNNLNKFQYLKKLIFTVVCGKYWTYKKIIFKIVMHINLVSKIIDILY